MAAFPLGNTSNLTQQRSSYPSSAKRLPHKEISRKIPGPFQFE
jgi:hypothetical protein